MWRYIATMEFSDYLLWKAGAIVAAAFVWGLYCGLTGRPLGRAQSDSQVAQDQRSAEGPAKR